MNNSHCQSTRGRCSQQGAAIVEFALVASIFFMVLLLLFEFGRLMFTWNTAVEATRRGARLAVVCNASNAKVTSAVLSMLPPEITAADVSINYPSNASGTIQAVTVEIAPTAAAIQYNFPLLMGFVSLSRNSWNIPKFSTTLTRESMQNNTSTDPLDANPDCAP